MSAAMTTHGEGRLEISLIPVPQAAELARVFVRHKIVCMGCAGLVDDACQIASEMVSNAVVVTATGDRKTQGSIRLRLGLNLHGRPLLEVWDSSSKMPIMKEPDFFSESGRGLHIIQALAARFGWYADEERGGKTVWALLR